MDIQLHTCPGAGASKEGIPPCKRARPQARVSEDPSHAAPATGVCGDSDFRGTFGVSLAYRPLRSFSCQLQEAGSVVLMVVIKLATRLPVYQDPLDMLSN